MIFLSVYYPNLNWAKFSHPWAWFMGSGQAGNKSVIDLIQAIITQGSLLANQKNETPLPGVRHIFNAEPVMNVGNESFLLSTHYLLTFIRSWVDEIVLTNRSRQFLLGKILGQTQLKLHHVSCFCNLNDSHHDIVLSSWNSNLPFPLDSNMRRCMVMYVC